MSIGYNPFDFMDWMIDREFLEQIEEKENENDKTRISNNGNTIITGIKNE